MLSVFARHIQKIIGDKGLVARMGGEEFAVAVPSVNPVDGLLMAEKIRKGVELQPFTWQQKTLYLTVSIGVGSGRASYRTLTDDFNKLMVEADTCLYRSKKDGRNRTSTMRTVRKLSDIFVHSERFKCNVFYHFMIQEKAFFLD